MAITKVFQLGNSGTIDGKDTMIATYPWSATTNYGSDTTAVSGRGADMTYQSRYMIDFELWKQGLPKKLKFISPALLEFYLTAKTGTDTLSDFLGYCLTNWVETEVTWNIWKTGNNWTTAGAQGEGTDFEDFFYRQYQNRVTDSVPVASNWYSLEIPPHALEKMMSQTYFGIIFMHSINVNNYISIATKENATTANRPKLTITYEPYIKIFPISAGLGQVR